MPHSLDSLLTAYQYLLPKHLLSRAVGNIADSEIPSLKNFLIERFARAYNVNLSEAEFSQPDQYRSFNHFFTRALKPDARTIDPNPNHIISPVDGTISQLGKITEVGIVIAISDIDSGLGKPVVVADIDSGLGKPATVVDTAFP